LTKDVERERECVCDGPETLTIFNPTSTAARKKKGEWCQSLASLAGCVVLFSKVADVNRFEQQQ